MKTRPQQVYTWHGGITPIPTRRPDFDVRIIAELLHQEFGGKTRRWVEAHEAGENPAPLYVAEMGQPGTKPGRPGGRGKP